MNLVRSWVKRSPLYRSPLYLHASAWKRRLGDRTAVERWESQGRPPPPPHVVKEGLVKKIARARGLRTLVETGTLMGEMVFAMRNEFDRIYSIELEPLLFKNARSRLQRYGHVEILQGDSATVLPALVQQLSSPALFWLDGHYSGGLTAKGSLDTPIRQELDAILRADENHVALVDDAHLFTGANDYPTVEELASFVRALRPNAQISTSENVIQIL